MRLFISQPMKDKTVEEITETRELAIQKAKEFLKTNDVEVINSYIKENVPENDNQGLWYLGKSLELLASADCIYFTEDWHDYRGCKIEHLCAEEYGIKIISK